MTWQRKQFHLGILLLAFIPFALTALLVRPYLSPPLDWSEFTLDDLQRHQSNNEMVIVYFRDDWMMGFNRIQRTLQSRQVEYQLRASGIVPMIANRTLENTESLGELTRVSGSTNLPIVAIYPRNPDMQPVVLGGEIEKQAVLDAISQITDLEHAR